MMVATSRMTWPALALATWAPTAALGQSADATQAVAIPEVKIQTPPPAPKRSVPSKPKGVAAAGGAPLAPAKANANASADAAPAATANVPAEAAGVAAGPARPSSLASEITVSGAEINTRPVTRPGEVLEAAPGLIVTQHSGEGKANQYFLRGYNLDHGTDLAIFVDDVPINLRTHAHGQGYSDLNWLIPELVGTVLVRKGPYYADEGDFGSAGALHIGFIDSYQGRLASFTAGSFGYLRAFGLTGTKAGDGRLLAAIETSSYDGPWKRPDDIQKINGLLRYTQGSATNGLSLTAMAYSNRWFSTDQVPERAITAGLIDRFGAEDPTDGGKTSRFSLSGRIARTDGDVLWKANAYAIKSELDLFNNFTYFLADPINGDQFHQHDDRVLAGGSVARVQKGALGPVPVETEIGAQTRYDHIDLGLSDTYRRALLAPVRSDRVDESSLGLYADTTLRWTPWLRTTLGWRADVFQVDVNSLTDPSNSGNKTAALGSPKFSAVIGPFSKTELFFGAGYGMHSNDARGVTITEAPTDPTTKLNASPLLVRTRGLEAGIRSKLVPDLDTSLSVFLLDQDSEILFSGDAGDTSASRPSRRLGFEWTGEYRPAPWMLIEGELAMTHARFLGYDADQAATFASLAGYPQAQAGNAPGNYIPNAPAVVASAGITLGGQTGWFGGLKWRYLGASPLTEDNAFRSPPTSVVNARIGYHFADGWTAQLDALNLLDTRTNQITYAYGSLLKTDSLYDLCYVAKTAPTAVCQAGVTDRVLHPIEPLAVRLTVSRRF